MATIRGYIAASLDGFIADRDGNVDWLRPYENLDLGYGGFIAGIRVIVMGRRTYDQIRSFGGPWPYARQTCFVVTSRAIGAAPEAVHPWHKGIPALAGHLRALKNGDVWVVGGAMLQSAMLDLGALDRLELFIMPELLGRGLPLFRRLVNLRRLELRSTQGLAGGVVKLDYHFGPADGRVDDRR